MDKNTYTGRPIKLTSAQRRELKILKEHYSITTEGLGSRFNVLARLSEKGLVYSGPTGHENVFLLTELGKTIDL